MLYVGARCVAPGALRERQYFRQDLQDFFTLSGSKSEITNLCLRLSFTRHSPAPVLRSSYATEGGCPGNPVYCFSLRLHFFRYHVYPWPRPGNKIIVFVIQCL
jgi:hypothetical protein